MGNLSRNIKAARDEREWSQEDLAHRAGMQPADLSRIEAGKRDPRLSTIEKIAKAFGISPGRLLD